MAGIAGRKRDEGYAAIMAAGAKGRLRRPDTRTGYRCGGRGSWGGPSPERHSGIYSRRGELGDNSHGELGNGTGFGSSLPGGVTGLGRDVSQVAAGRTFALARKSDGTVMTWGPNQDGQLGVGPDTPFALTPVAVTAIGSGSVRGISMGSAGTAMALFTDGSLWEWGHNLDGDIPGAQGNVVPTPRETTAPGSGITQVSAGLSHVLALRSNETVLAWGDNGAGELGDGTTAAAAGPVQVSGLSNTVQVVAGWYYSLALQMVRSIIILPLTR
jgi:alpha-tubulin suppressor-like RCC1 family protein